MPNSAAMAGTYRPMLGLWPAHFGRQYTLGTLGSLGSIGSIGSLGSAAMRVCYLRTAQIKPCGRANVVTNCCGCSFLVLRRIGDLDQPANAGKMSP